MCVCVIAIRCLSQFCVYGCVGSYRSLITYRRRRSSHHVFLLCAWALNCQSYTESRYLSIRIPYPQPDRAVACPKHFATACKHITSPKTHLLALGIIVSGIPLLGLILCCDHVSGRLSEGLARRLRRHCDSPGWLTWGWVVKERKTLGVDECAQNDRIL